LSAGAGAAAVVAGEQPRIKSAELIVKRAPELSQGGPVILVGDLNAGAPKH
jgi:endonuclease/exonuclease/phosphatase family metal-dependent hydrolase